VTLSGEIVDLSSNNGDPSKWNWPAMRAAGVIAVIAKATDGTRYTNPYFLATRQCARAMGLSFAAYHFAEWGDPGAEARYFMSVAGPDAKVLDSETNGNVAWQNQFLTDLGLAGNQELDYGSASTLPRTGIRSMLWPASYGRDYGFGDCWQDTDALRVNGCPVALDASEWVGSVADYDSFFGSTPHIPVVLPTTITRLFTNREVPLTEAEFFVWVRGWWYLLRTDLPAVGEANLLWTLFNTPTTSQVMGVNGFAGSLDLVLANIHDTAGAHLK
jgi:hypothetical protein